MNKEKRERRNNIYQANVKKRGEITNKLTINKEIPSKTSPSTACLLAKRKISVQSAFANTDGDSIAFPHMPAFNNSKKQATSLVIFMFDLFFPL